MTKRRRRLRFFSMHLLDSISTLDARFRRKASPARASRRGREPATKTAEIQPLPRWARPQSADPGAAIFSAGAGLALFDQLLRGGAETAREPVFAGCLRQRLALKAAESCATLARLREDAGALRDAEHLPGRRRDEPGRSAASPVPALRVAAGPRRRGDARARRSCSGCRKRSTPARSPPLPPRRPTRSWRQRGPAPPR